MKRSTSLLAAMLFAALASPALAGPRFDFKTCPLPLGKDGSFVPALRYCRNVLAMIHLQLPEWQVTDYYALGQLQHFDHQYDAAIENYSMAIQQWHKAPEPYYARGDAYAAEGKTALAAQDYADGRALNRDTRDVLQERCWLRALRGGPYDLGLFDCEQVLTSDPKNASVLFSRGLIRYRSGDVARALTDLDAALAIRSDIAGALLVRGLAKTRLGDASGAASDLAAAEKLKHGIAASYAILGIGP